MDRTSSAARRWKAGVRQGALLVLAAVALGALFNAIQPHGLPWGTPWAPSEINDGNLEALEEISLEEAWALHKAGLALFLDARDPIKYQEGHIAGAMNVPPEEAEAYVEDLLALGDSGLELIAYCDGADCPLDAELARTLQALGIHSVKVLVDGWTAWLEAGYPAEMESG